MADTKKVLKEIIIERVTNGYVITATYSEGDNAWDTSDERYVADSKRDVVELIERVLGGA